MFERLIVQLPLLVQLSRLQSRVGNQVVYHPAEYVRSLWVLGRDGVQRDGGGLNIHLERIFGPILRFVWLTFQERRERAVHSHLLYFTNAGPLETRRVHRVNERM